MEPQPLVNFFVVGVQKAGTTALFDYLSEDPAIALSRVKETHFFDDEAVDWAAPDYGRYHALFEPAGGGVVGEATPIYAYWPRALERLHAYNPAARLVLMLRDPVERAWSHWRMEFARGAEKAPFAWCVREGRQRLFEAEPWGFHREFSYVERGFYGEQVERLYGLFPRDQVLILLADELRREPNKVLSRIAAFIGVPQRSSVEARDVHVGREIDGSDLTEADVRHLKLVYARDMERLADLTGVRFG